MWSYFAVWSLLFFVFVYGTPLKNTGSSQYDGKLQKLQHLLSDIGQGHGGETAAKEQRSTSEGQDRLKTLARKLSEGDRNSYLALDKALADLGYGVKKPLLGNSDTTGEDLGKFLESPADDVSSRPREADDKRSMSPTLEKKILDLLRPKEATSHDERQVERTGPRQSQPHQQIEEGQFGDFRHEVLHAVEDRLMSDLKMALRSGLTIQEVISDLESADEKWSDSAKRNKITRELDRLTRLPERDGRM